MLSLVVYSPTFHYFTSSSTLVSIVFVICTRSVKFCISSLLIVPMLISSVY